MIYDLSHTIAAIATATGESGVGIIRISGTEAYNIGEKIFCSKGKTRFKDFKDRTI
ncbi:MAG: tRNA uridine-5-carboxymethylaminomethyl(34) synthesis GTPase MnmE, partial [Megasphaera micronuciformis]|nr:tRNA uridine-5-carboxymethylaminomethyl(34) synthesis GTPase MnmE [Megasphaera micronuciformis]